MRELGPDDDPLDTVLVMIQPTPYGELAGWQIACGHLKNALRRANHRIQILEDRLDVLAGERQSVDFQGEKK